MKSKTMKLDLSKAKVGDKFVTREGTVVEYERWNKIETKYPHYIGGNWYTNSGHYWSNGDEHSVDIVSSVTPKRPVGRPRKEKPVKVMGKAAAPRGTSVETYTINLPNSASWIEVATYLAKKGHDAAALDVLKEKVQ